MKIEDYIADFQIPQYLHYMDNAATSLITEPVIASMNEYDQQYRANVGRGMHRLTRVATQRYQDAHDSISDFIGGKNEYSYYCIQRCNHYSCNKYGRAIRAYYYWLCERSKNEQFTGLERIRHQEST